MRVMAFMSHRDGVGKTTLAGHVGVQAQLRCGEKVALLDATKTRDLSSWSEARGWAAPECIGAKVSRLEGLLKLLRLSGTDLAVIDAPAAAPTAAAHIAELADLVVIPTAPEQERMPTIAPTVRLAKKAGKPFVFLFNRANGNSAMTGATAFALARHGIVSPVVVPRSKWLAEAMKRGQTVVDLDRKPARTIGDLWDYLEYRLDCWPDLESETPGRGRRERRAYPRWRFADDAILVVDGRALPCSVNDISVSGISVFMRRPPPVGKKVKVYVPRLGAYPAEVVNCIADRVGLRFDMKGGEQWKLVKRLCRAVDQGLELERA